MKPRGAPSQADRTGDEDLLSAMKAYIAKVYSKPGAAYLGLVHRLDRPVGGLMAFARTSKAAGRLSEAFASGAVIKRYLAVVEGAHAPPMELEDSLSKDPDSGTVAVVRSGSGGKLARLSSRPLASVGGTTLMEVAPETGRAHQIRAQHANAGFPLWGDRRYGGEAREAGVALWACGLGFRHPVRDEWAEFFAPPPDDSIWGAYREAIAGYRPDLGRGIWVG